MKVFKSKEIWIVDDDNELRIMVKEYLLKLKYKVREIELGNQLLPLLKIKKPDLIVLDLMLPDVDGLTLLSSIRKSDYAHIPILMLTSRADGVDRIIGIELGADDYMGKPFLPRELSARISSILKRCENKISYQGIPILNKDSFIFGPFKLNFQERILYKENIKINLTTGEFVLLNSLVDHPNRPLSRQKLLDLIGGCDSITDERSIDVQISRLRKIIEEEVSKPFYIQTVWGYGYVFNPGNKNEN